MARAFYKGQRFESIRVLPEWDGEFDHCVLERCDFSRQEFDGAEFAHCTFLNCDLSNAILENLALHHTVFSGCKWVGVDFGKCSKYQFSAQFVDCILDYAVFDHNTLKKIHFERCSLREVSFNECHLGEAWFDHCTLERAVFTRCNLEGADFRTAMDYALDPQQNRVRQARFALPGVLRLLDPLQIRID